MTQYTFSPKDFKAFEVEGLDQRMEALNDYVRPQLHQLGSYFEEYFTTQTGETFYAHVAKHARRSVNPPIDTWVAFALINVVIKCYHTFKSDCLEISFSLCSVSCTKVEIKKKK